MYCTGYNEQITLNVHKGRIPDLTYTSPYIMWSKRTDTDFLHDSVM